MSYSGFNQRRYAPKAEKPSKVLLVCVYDTIVFEITEQTIRAKFGKMGTITKLLIFDKGQVTKFFIQYSDIQQAIQAKKKLDGVKLCDTLCKMSIYFSNFANVDLKHQSVEQSVFNSYEPNLADPKYFDYSVHTKSTNKERQLNQIDFLQQQNIMKAFGGQFDVFHRSKTDNPKTLQEQMVKMKKQKVIDEQEELQNSIQKSIDSLIGIPLQENVIAKKESDSQVKIKQDSDLRSQILFFSARFKIKPQWIYNLYSNFGNISCIIIKKQHVYIKFRTRQFAAIAITYLNNTIINGNAMVLKQCPESSSLWHPNENQYCEAMYYDASYDRFTPQRSITINPPSNTLHVSSMKKQICQEHVLIDIFQEFGNVQKVHILQQSNQRNMALVKFSNIQDSFAAIANLHNESFSGRKMQISFTKSRV